MKLSRRNFLSSGTAGLIGLSPPDLVIASSTKNTTFSSFPADDHLKAYLRPTVSANSYLRLKKDPSKQQYLKVFICSDGT